MQPAVFSRFAKVGAGQFQQCRRFAGTSQVMPSQQRVVAQGVSTPQNSMGEFNGPLASSFIQPLPIPGIRRAPRTPTLPADSKYRKYGSTTGDRFFPVVATASFLLPLYLITKYF